MIVKNRIPFFIQATESLKLPMQTHRLIALEFNFEEEVTRPTVHPSRSRPIWAVMKFDCHLFICDANYWYNNLIIIKILLILQKYAYFPLPDQSNSFFISH